MRTTHKGWYRLLITFSITFTFLVLLHSCMTFRMSKKELDQYLSSKTLNGSHHDYTVNNQTIHYAKAGDETRPLLLFVHGSPGSLSAFIEFLSDTVLTKHALTISVDRPGFGHSNFGTAEPSLKKQAAALEPILEKYKNNRPIILIGHSLGGPVIGRMAMDYPELVDGLVFVSASVDPKLEPNEAWFRAPLSTPFINWILPRSFRASNDEIYHVKPQLEAMIPLWKNILCPVQIVHGGKDKLVPPANVEFAQQVLENTTVEVIYREDVNHFIPWKNPELIQEAILKLLKSQPNQIHP